MGCVAVNTVILSPLSVVTVELPDWICFLKKPRNRSTLRYIGRGRGCVGGVCFFGIDDLYWQVNEPIKMCSARVPFFPHQPATVLWPGLELQPK